MVLARLALVLTVGPRLGHSGSGPTFLVPGQIFQFLVLVLPAGLGLGSSGCDSYCKSQVR